jgi:hypothetical protein
MYLWDDQDMRRRLRAQIVEGDANIVFVNLCRRDSSRSYLAENAVLGSHIASKVIKA